MTGKRCILFAGVFALWMIAPGSGHAFEQKVPPQSAAPAPAAPAPADRALSLEDIEKDAKPNKTGRGIKLPGFGKLSLPKLNFGLDLMYGNGDSSDAELGFSPELDGDEDVTIMGKVKRRF